MTNYEKIKSLDISELAKFINQNVSCLDCMAYRICDDFPSLTCDEIIEKWLKMEEENN